MKYFILFGFLLPTIASADVEVMGELKRISSMGRTLSYICKIEKQVTEPRVKVTLDMDSRWMETFLDEGVVIKGYATETLETQTGTTTYFVQGSSAPYAQQLSLVIRDNGNWAQFTRANGGKVFVCASGAAN
jgi:hypothetical protein